MAKKDIKDLEIFVKEMEKRHTKAIDELKAQLQAFDEKHERDINQLTNLINDLVTQVSDRGTVGVKRKEPVFRMPQPPFKKPEGSSTIVGQLPASASASASASSGKLKPMAILTRRPVPRNNIAATQWLIQWEAESPTKATWEFADDLMHRFPDFQAGLESFADGSSDSE